MKITRQQYGSLPPRTVSGRSMRSVAEAAIAAASSDQAQPRRKQKSRALLVTESQEQATLIAWCDSFAAPSLARFLFAIPNGAKLPYHTRSNGKRSSPEAAKLLREGMRPGIPDLCLPIPAGGFHSLWIEMKAGKNKTTPEQDFWIATLRTEGHRVEVCYGAEAAKKVIVEYLGAYAPFKNRWRYSLMVTDGLKERMETAAIQPAGRPAKERIGDWIQVYTGGQMFPLDPRPEEIDIQDIAHSLAMQCRFNGHTKRYYSVAEHCCHVSDILPDGLDRLKLAGLLHDASEAYLCDLPRPIKRSSGFSEPYLIAERRLERIIAIRFGFEFPYDPAIHGADNRLLCTEALQLMAPLHPEWRDRHRPVEGLVLPCWSPEEAREQFLRRYFALTDSEAAIG